MLLAVTLAFLITVSPFYLLQVCYFLNGYCSQYLFIHETIPKLHFPKWSIQELPEVEICQLIDYHKQVFIHFQVAIVFWDFRASGLDTARYYVAYHIMRSCYYTNSALNFYLYCLSGSRFRYSFSTPFVHLLLFSKILRFTDFYNFLSFNETLFYL